MIGNADQLTQLTCSCVFGPLSFFCALRSPSAGQSAVSILPGVIEPLLKILKGILLIPGAGLVMLLIFWYLLGFLWYSRNKRSLTQRTAAKLNMILRYTFNLPISLKKLEDLMQYKYIESEDLERESVSSLHQPPSSVCASRCTYLLRVLLVK